MYFCLSGADRYYNIVTDMIGYRPVPYIKYSLEVLYTVHYHSE